MKFSGGTRDELRAVRYVNMCTLLFSWIVAVQLSTTIVLVQGSGICMDRVPTGGQVQVVLSDGPPAAFAAVFLFNPSQHSENFLFQEKVQLIDPRDRALRYGEPCMTDKDGTFDWPTVEAQYDLLICTDQEEAFLPRQKSIPVQVRLTPINRISVILVCENGAPASGVRCTVEGKTVREDSRLLSIDETVSRDGTGEIILRDAGGDLFRKYSAIIVKPIILSDSPVESVAITEYPARSVQLSVPNLAKWELECRDLAGHTFLKNPAIRLSVGSGQQGEVKHYQQEVDGRGACHFYPIEAGTPIVISLVGSDYSAAPIVHCARGLQAGEINRTILAVDPAQWRLIMVDIKYPTERPPPLVADWSISGLGHSLSGVCILTPPSNTVALLLAKSTEPSLLQVYCTLQFALLGSVEIPRIPSIPERYYLNYK